MTPCDDGRGRQTEHGGTWEIRTDVVDCGRCGSYAPAVRDKNHCPDRPTAVVVIIIVVVVIVERSPRSSVGQLFSLPSLLTPQCRRTSTVPCRFPTTTVTADERWSFSPATMPDRREPIIPERLPTRTFFTRAPRRNKTKQRTKHDDNTGTHTRAETRTS